MALLSNLDPFQLSTLAIVVMYIATYIAIKIGAEMTFSKREHEDLRSYHTLAFSIGFVLAAIVPLFVLHDALKADYSALTLLPAIIAICVSIALPVVAWARS